MTCMDEALRFPPHHCPSKYGSLFFVRLLREPLLTVLSQSVTLPRSLALNLSKEVFTNCHGHDGLDHGICFCLRPKHCSTAGTECARTQHIMCDSGMLLPQVLRGLCFALRS
jgi:hypothetical protein